MNKITISGRMVKSAEVRITNTGKKVVSFTIADNGNGKNKDQKPQFWNVTCWGKTADFSEGLNKGTLLTVEGTASQEKYEKDDKTFYSTKVTAFNIKVTVQYQSSSQGA